MKGNKLSPAKVNPSELTKLISENTGGVIVDNLQEHVSSEFNYNGQTYQANLSGLSALMDAVRGQRNALKLALAWSLDRALICTQNSQKGPIVAALEAIAKEEPSLLKKAKAYVEAYAPYLVLTWKDAVSTKGIISEDTKSAPHVEYIKWNELPNRKLARKLEGLLQFKPVKATTKAVVPVTEKQAENLAERLEVSDQEAQEAVITKLMTGKTAASAAVAAIEGIKTMAVKQVFSDSEKLAVLTALEGLAKHLWPAAGHPDSLQFALETKRAAQQAAAENTDTLQDALELEKSTQLEEAAKKVVKPAAKKVTKKVV